MTLIFEAGRKMEVSVLSDVKLVIQTLILPPGLIVMSGLFGLLFWQRCWGRPLIFVSLLLLYLLSTLYFMTLLARGIESYPAIPAANIKEHGAEAILVFMADLYTSAPELEGRDSISRLSMDRLSYAVLVHRSTGLPLILSGGSGRSGVTPVAQAANDFLQNRFQLKAQMLETVSRNTWENALFSGELLKRQGIKKVALVTHAWHMPRAMFSLEHTGVQAIPAPTRFIYRGMQPFNVATLLPTSRSFRDSCLLLHEYVGLLWYQLKDQLLFK